MRSWSASNITIWSVQTLVDTIRAGLGSAEIIAVGMATTANKKTCKNALVTVEIDDSTRRLETL